jgi:ubiquinone/menaquinone biosynthesis C-methylase UbiE
LVVTTGLTGLEAAPASSWSNDGFANAMAGGMADYERSLAPLKAALFSDGAIARGGQLLELGCGTGPSLRYFGAASRVVAVEPNTAMHPLAADSATRAGIGAKFSLVAATAERLPFEDASFDTVVGAFILHLDGLRTAAAVSGAMRRVGCPHARRYAALRLRLTATMVMCSVRDMNASLAEVRRVLRPGGHFVFIEHVAAPRGSALWALQVRSVLRWIRVTPRGILPFCCAAYR